MIGTSASADRQPALEQCLHLRHAKARGDPRRAAAPGPDADFDAVGAAFDQEPGAFRGGDVAGDHLRVAESLSEFRDRALHHDRVAVRDVDHDDVDVRAKSSPARSR